MTILGFSESDEEKEVIIAATGDSMISRRLSSYTEKKYLDMVKILREADVATTNLEGMIHNFEGYCYKPYSLGTPMRAPPFTAEELKWMGFNTVNTANNHSMDYSEESMLAMFKALDAAGIPHAGMGRDLAEARMPTYLEIKKGRVALIGASEVASGDRDQAGTPWSIAGYAAPGVRGRPGVNGIRVNTTYIISKKAMDELREIRESLKIPVPRFYGEDTPLRDKAEEEDELIFINKRFKVGDKPDVLLTPNAADVEANLREIRGAKKQADWVLFHFHAHAADVDHDMPAPFMRRFAKDCIDAGADASIGHGHHHSCGVEIYRGKPIFYSLGTFIMQTETLDRLPADSYEKYGISDPFKSTIGEWSDARLVLWKGYLEEWFYQTVIARFILSDGELTELKLYPVDARYKAPRADRGRPMLADGAMAKKIIERYQKLSASFGTEIVYKDGVGVVKL